MDVAARPPPDTVCVVVTDKLDGKTGDSPWVKAIEQHGVWVRVWPIDTAALPGWLRARAASLRVDMDADAAQLIVERVEGNLLAAKQELEKLALLCDGKRISADLVLRSVGDSARYDVFQLAEAACGGRRRAGAAHFVGFERRRRRAHAHFVGIDSRAARTVADARAESVAFE